MATVPATGVPVDYQFMVLDMSGKPNTQVLDMSEAGEPTTCPKCGSTTRALRSALAKTKRQLRRCRERQEWRIRQ